MFGNNQDNTGIPEPILSLPGEIFEMVQHLVRPDWLSQIEIEGQLVRLYRDYVEGRQRSFLTSKQRAMLNIKNIATEQIYINYCDMVVQTMADRLMVTAIDGDSPEANAWSAEVLNFNRFDGLQMDTIDGSLRDGVDYMMMAYDNDAQMPTFAEEPAWDGSLGMIAIYDRMLKNIVVAIKVWYENSLYRRFNVYWPDRVEKYIEAEGDGQGTSKIVAVMEENGKPLEMLDTEGHRFGVRWVDQTTGQPLGVPVIPFRNRKKSHRSTGQSEIASVIPLNDSLNRTLIDTIMTSGLTAFQIKVALGFPAPATIAPGDWVEIGPEGLTKEQQVDAKVLEQGQIVPFISQMSFLIDQIGTISRTPLPTIMGGDNSSGEALKERDKGLVAKCERFQVKGGNDFEDMMAYAAKLQKAFGTKLPPEVKRWNTRWKDAQVRNDPQTLADAILVKDVVGEEETLRLIAPVFGWDETYIQKIRAQKQAAQQQALANLGGNPPNFGGFGNSFTDALTGQRTPAVTGS